MVKLVREDREVAAWKAQAFSQWHKDRTYELSRSIPGHYQVSSPMEWDMEQGVTYEQPYFANISKGSKYSGEMTSKWYADIRGRDGELQRYAGIHNTMDEAVQEVISILNGM